MKNNTHQKDIDNARRLRRDTAISVKIATANLDRLHEVALDKGQTISTFAHEAILAAIAKNTRKNGPSAQAAVTP